MYERILVPIDGSKLSETALPYAEELVRVLNPEVVLVSVCKPTESQYHHMHQLYIDKTAELMKSRIKERTIAKVTTTVLLGEPAEEIVNHAQKSGISLIIMVSHGSSGIMHRAMGSVTNNVLRATTIPVLLIKVTEPYLEAPREHLLDRILLPLDGSEAGEAAVPYIKELTNRLESEVILLGVVPSGQHVRTIGGLDYILYPDQHVELTKAEAKEYLDKVCHRLVSDKGTVGAEVRVGNVTQEIIKFAEEANIRLIAISAHGRSGVRRWVFGSNAHKILHASKAPVLLVKAPGAKV